MPVSGFKHPRVWQYSFIPKPVTLLDRGWENRDREWERDVVEKLRRGAAAPRAVSLNDMLTPDSRHYSEPHGGWKQTEEWARNAIRTNAVFLNDEAIARRLPEREAREKAYEEYLRETAERAELQRVRYEEHKAEWERVAHEEAERVMRRKEEKARRDAEWKERQNPLYERQEIDRRDILRTKWACKCGIIVHMAWDGEKNLFLVWCPACNETTYKRQDKLAARLRGEI